ncbi:FAD-binding protein, partial [Burkholderia sp. LMG 13014]
MRREIESIDDSAALVAQVDAAIHDCQPLHIRGAGTKAFLGRPVEGRTLDVRTHRGVVSYDPTELVVTARAGTPLAELEAM